MLILLTIIVNFNFENCILKVSRSLWLYCVFVILGECIFNFIFPICFFFCVLCHRLDINSINS